MLKLGVMGAGAVGCTIGGRLAAVGNDVRLVGRPEQQRRIVDHGLCLADLTRTRVRLAPDDVDFYTNPSALGDRDAVFFAVKGRDTDAAARQLAPHLRPGATVISLQNGVHSVARIAPHLPQNRVLAGMVTFNIVRGEAHFQQATAGPVVLDAAADRQIVAALKAAGLAVKQRRDMQSVLWCKLLFNLNNAINALSGLPLRQQLAQRTYRLVFAGCMREGLRTARAAGVRVRPIGRMYPQVVVNLLRLPDQAFALLARLITVDAKARSSMWDDLQRGRSTEVDILNGEIVAEGRRFGVLTPINERIVELVRGAEQRAEGSPAIDAARLLSLVSPG